MAKMKSLLAVFGCLFWMGCSAYQTAADAGEVDENRDGISPQEEIGFGPDEFLSEGEWIPAEIDISRFFGFLIPDQSEMCSMNGRQDPIIEYRLLSRLGFKPGIQLLPKDQDSFQMDWIDWVLLGPDRRSPQPQDLAQCTRSLSGSSANGVFRFDCEQIWVDNPVAFHLFWHLEFEVQDGLAIQPVQVLDEKAMLGMWQHYEKGNGLWSILGDGSDPLYQRQRYNTCRYSSYETIQHSLVLEDGATLTLSQRMLKEDRPCFWACPSALVKANVQKGVEQQEVGDFFRLVHTNAVHNFYQQFVVVLDSPVESVNALHMTLSADTPTVEYLDENLQNPVAVKVVDYQCDGYPYWP